MSNVVSLRSVRQREHRRIHVWRHETFFEVIHESASGDSFAPIEHYSLDRREEAVGCALAWVRDNPGVILGDVAPAVL